MRIYVSEVPTTGNKVQYRSINSHLLLGNRGLLSSFRLLPLLLLKNRANGPHILDRSLLSERWLRTYKLKTKEQLAETKDNPEYTKSQTYLANQTKISL